MLILHGLGSTSADHVNIYPNISLGYILWDAGYDVWVGSTRGSTYSDKHETLDKEKNSKEFYDFR